MDLADTEAALQAWVVAQTGLQPALVTWENAARGFIAGGAAVYLSWVSDAGVGVDETRYEDGGSPAPNANLTATLVGDRLLSLQVACESFSQSPAAPSGRALALALRDRLRMPSSLSAFAAANLGLVDAAPIQQADYKAADQRWVQRVVFDVRFNATSFVRDDAPSFGSLESVDVSSHATDQAGVALPAGSQMVAVAIPNAQGGP